MKIIVTGGAGFLGSHLCDALIKRGDNVVCVDNLLTGDKKNIKHLLDNLKFQFLEQSVTDPLPQDLNADQVYHLASPASPNIHSAKSYHALAFETMEVNTKATWLLSKYCVDHNAKFLFASTSEAYGEPLEHPQKELYRGNVSTTGPRSVYDEAKRYGETIVAAFVRVKKLDGRIVRIFNTYGPRMAADDGRVVTEFLHAALADGPIPIFGDGKQTRSFCYVDDLVQGLILAMDKPETSGQVINLGNPDEFTILELAQKIIVQTQSKSEIKTVEPMPEDDPHRRCPDIQKAQALLDWRPAIDLDSGLQKLIDSIKTA